MALCNQLQFLHMNSVRFQEHKKYFQSIPHEQRSLFLSEMLKKPQLPGSPILHHLQYPSQSSFNYLSFKLNYYCSQTTTAPDVIVVFLHGLYSYGGNSGYMGVNITKSIAGTNFYSLDFLNFGKSVGDCRGYIHSFDQLVTEGQAFVDHLLTKFQKAPKIFLVGESLGGAVVCKMAIMQPTRYNGVIFLNPALRQIKEQQVIMKKIGKIIGYLIPKFKLTNQSFKSTTKYDTEANVLANQWMYNGRHIPGSVRAALNAMQEIQNSYKYFKTPYILFQGGVDKSVDLFAPLDFEKQCQSKDKTTVYIKQMWHSVFFEEEVKDLTQMVIDWLAKRV